MKATSSLKVSLKHFFSLIRINPQVLLQAFSDALSFVGHAGFLTSLKRNVLLWKRSWVKIFNCCVRRQLPWQPGCFETNYQENIDEITKAKKVATRIATNPSGKGDHSNATSTSSNQSKHRRFLDQEVAGPSVSTVLQANTRGTARLPKEPRRGRTKTQTRIKCKNYSLSCG